MTRLQLMVKLGPATAAVMPRPLLLLLLLLVPLLPLPAEAAAPAREVLSDSWLSDRQLEEFSLLGKFQLGQIRRPAARLLSDFFVFLVCKPGLVGWMVGEELTPVPGRSQLDYEAWRRNYDLNIGLALRKVGILQEEPGEQTRSADSSCRAPSQF